MRPAACFLALIFVSLLAAQGSAPAKDLRALLPKAHFAPGWVMDMEPARYTPNNLFEYIDGEAELYNDYQFAEMATAAYVLQGDASETFSVDVYDMGTPLNAFGIYSSYRRPELQFEAIGEEAIVSDLNIRFYRGRHYVQVNGGALTPVVKAAMRKVAVQIASAIPAAEQPAELKLLPAESQVPHSLKYMRKGFMGQEAFTSGLQAKYVLPAGECTAFLVLKESNASAMAAFKKYRDSVAERGKVQSYVEANGTARLIANVPYQGNILAAVHEGYIAGVSGYEKQPEAEELLTNVLAELGK